MSSKGNTNDIFALKALANLGNFELCFEVLIKKRGENENPRSVQDLKSNM